MNRMAPTKVNAGPGKLCSERVRRLLRSELLKGDCSVDAVAGRLSLNRRTLSRRLRAEGTGFRDLANEIRLEIALKLLAVPDMTFEQIASVMHFSEPAAFTRAFRRWSGSTPTEWRQTHSQPAATSREMTR